MVEEIENKLKEIDQKYKSGEITLKEYSEELRKLANEFDNWVYDNG